jgi:hypothetical protein
VVTVSVEILEGFNSTVADEMPKNLFGDKKGGSIHPPEKPE